MSDSTNKHIEQKHFYDTHHPEYLEYSKNIPYAAYLVEKILKSLNGKRDYILEVGCGEGRFTLELAKSIKKLKAIDISKKEITKLQQYAKKDGISNITAVTSDILALDKGLIDEKFDHLVGFFILHHIAKEKYPKLVKNFAQLLNTRGRLSFIEPNSLYPFHLVEIMITPDMKWEIERQIYTNYLGSFKKACESEGLKIVNFQRFGFFPPPFINKWPKVVKLDKYFENIPLLKQFICPFIAVTAERY